MHRNSGFAAGVNSPEGAEASPTAACWARVRAGFTHCCLRAVAVCVFLVAGAQVHAETQAPRVYRCDLPTGVVAFSDRYCGENALLLNLQAAPPQGLSFGAAGDFTAVAEDNAERARARRAERLRRRQNDLSQTHRTAVSQLRERRSKLPNNAFKQRRARELDEQIEQLESSYLEEKHRLLDKFRAQ